MLRIVFEKKKEKRKKKKKKVLYTTPFFVWIIFNFINQTGAGYKWDQSTSLADLRP